MSLRAFFCTPSELRKAQLLLFLPTTDGVPRRDTADKEIDA